MKYIHFIAIILSSIGIIIRFFNWPVSKSFLLIGMLILAITYLFSAINSLRKKLGSRLIVHDILIVLCCLAIITKYNYIYFGEQVSLISVPLFLLSSINYFINVVPKQITRHYTSVFLVLLSIPLFGIDFYRSPRNLIQLFNKYDVKIEFIEFSYPFKSKLAEELNIKARHALFEGDYHKSIKLYNESLTLESDNIENLIGLSQAYAYLEKFDLAIELLDQAIELDPNFSLLYNNRGLIYYKKTQNEKAILDFKRAINLDSTYSSYYSNISLALYFNKQYSDSCENLEKALIMGFDPIKIGEMYDLIKSECR